jgi:hypothetical protein
VYVENVQDYLGRLKRFNFILIRSAEEYLISVTITNCLSPDLRSRFLITPLSIPSSRSTRRAAWPRTCA